MHWTQKVVVSLQSFSGAVLLVLMSRRRGGTRVVFELRPKNTRRYFLRLNCCFPLLIAALLLSEFVMGRKGHMLTFNSSRTNTSRGSGNSFVDGLLIEYLGKGMCCRRNHIEYVIECQVQKHNHSVASDNLCFLGLFASCKSICSNILQDTWHGVEHLQGYCSIVVCTSLLTQARRLKNDSSQ